MNFARTFHTCYNVVRADSVGGLSYVSRNTASVRPFLEGLKPHCRPTEISVLLHSASGHLSGSTSINVAPAPSVSIHTPATPPTTASTAAQDSSRRNCNWESHNTRRKSQAGNGVRFSCDVSLDALKFIYFYTSGCQRSGGFDGQGIG